MRSTSKATSRAFTNTSLCNRRVREPRSGLAGAPRLPCRVASPSAGARGVGRGGTGLGGTRLSFQLHGTVRSRRLVSRPASAAPISGGAWARRNSNARSVSAEVRDQYHVEIELAEKSWPTAAFHCKWVGLRQRIAHRAVELRVQRFRRRTRAGSSGGQPPAPRTPARSGRGGRAFFRAP